MSTYTLKQIGSVLLTFALFAWFTSWQVSLLFCIGVGFHEYSHILAAKMMKLKTGGFFLIPFVGGVSFVTSRYKTYGQQAFVALAGPIGGGLLAGVTAVAYHYTGYSFLALAANWMCILNLFNLLPFSFMDGGQVMGTITYSINRTLGMICYIVSTVIAIGALAYFAPTLAVLIILFGGVSVWMELKNWNYLRKGMTWMVSDYYLNPPNKLHPYQIAVIIMVWGGTILSLSKLLLSLQSITN